MLEWRCKGTCSPWPGRGPARRLRRVSSRGSAEVRPHPAACPRHSAWHAEGLKDRAPGAESRAAVGRRARGPGGGRAGAAGGIGGLELSAGLSEEGQGSARAAGRGPTLAGRGGPRAASPEGSLVAWGIGATGGCAGMGSESRGNGWRTLGCPGGELTREGR